MRHRIRRIVLCGLAASVFLLVAPTPSHAGWILTPGQGWVWVPGPAGPARPFRGPGFYRGYGWHRGFYHHFWHRGWRR